MLRIVRRAPVLKPPKPQTSLPSALLALAVQGRLGTASACHSTGETLKGWQNHCKKASPRPLRARCRSSSL